MNITNQGVAGHSSNVASESWMIVSVDQNPIIVNQFNNCLLDRKVRHKMMAGKYNGKSELSWLIPLDSYEELAEMGWFRDQESVMLIEPMTRENGTSGCPAWLMYTDNRPDEYLGLLRESVLRPTGDFTYDILNDTYYVCVASVLVAVKPLSRFTAEEKSKHFEAYKQGKVASAVPV